MASTKQRYLRKTKKGSRLSYALLRPPFGVSLAGDSGSAIWRSGLARSIPESSRGEAALAAGLQQPAKRGMPSVSAALGKALALRSLAPSSHSGPARSSAKSRRPARRGNTPPQPPPPLRRREASDRPERGLPKSRLRYPGPCDFRLLLRDPSRDWLAGFSLLARHCGTAFLNLAPPSPPPVLLSPCLLWRKWGGEHLTLNP